ASEEREQETGVAARHAFRCSHMIDMTAGLSLPTDPCVWSCRPGELCPGPALTRESRAGAKLGACSPVRGGGGAAVWPVGVWPGGCFRVRGGDEAAVWQV